MKYSSSSINDANVVLVLIKTILAEILKPFG